MDGRQDQIVLVLVRRPGGTAAGLRRIEGEIGQEALARRRGCGRDARAGRDRRGASTANRRAPPATGRRSTHQTETALARMPSQICVEQLASPGQCSAAATGGTARSPSDASLPRPLQVVRRAVPGPTPGQELQDAEGGESVARVFGPAEDCQHILDMRRLEEAQPAILDVGYVAAGQLQLQGGAVAGGAEQHRLVAQAEAGLAVGQDLPGDVARPGRGRRAPSPDRPALRAAAREQLLAVALAA